MLRDIILVATIKKYGKKVLYKKGKFIGIIKLQQTHNGFDMCFRGCAYRDIFNGDLCTSVCGAELWLFRECELGLALC